MPNADDVIARFEQRQAAKPPKTFYTVTVQFDVGVEKSEEAEETGLMFAEHLTRFSDVKNAKFVSVKEV